MSLMGTMIWGAGVVCQSWGRFAGACGPWLFCDFAGLREFSETPFRLFPSMSGLFDGCCIVSGVRGRGPVLCWRDLAGCRGGWCLGFVQATPASGIWGHFIVCGNGGVGEGLRYGLSGPGWPGRAGERPARRGASFWGHGASVEGPGRACGGWSGLRRCRDGRGGGWFPDGRVGWKGLVVKGLSG